MKLFALNSSKVFGELVAGELSIKPALHEEREFEDGEHKGRPLENVRNENVYVIQSLYSDREQSVNDKLCRLLFFMAALKDASARSVTAIIPYLCYARKDRRTKPRDPVTTRYIAQLFEAVKPDGIVTIDVHNLQAFQNAFRIPSINLEAKKLFSDFLVKEARNDNIVIMSPDTGGIKRAEQLQELLSRRLQKDIGLAFMEKYRSSGKVWGEMIAGDVTNRTVIIVDDLVSTGGTLSRTAAACRKKGASKIWAMATHGIFTGKPDETLLENGPEKIIITNTIPPFRLENCRIKEKVQVLNVAPLFAETIRRLNEGGSVTALLEDQ